MSSTVTKSVDVKAPVRAVYNQWTQFEEFPRFMEGVEEVRQISEKRLHWRAKVGGHVKEWEADILSQVPDQRVEWKNATGAHNAGVVDFLPNEDGTTRVTAIIAYEPENWVETVGDVLGFMGRRVQGDLDRFKAFVEANGSETGAWRGEIQDGEVKKGDSGGAAGSASGAQL